MGVTINGNNITVPGTATFSSAPSIPTEAARLGDLGSVKVTIAELDLNTGPAPLDLPILVVGSTSYIPLTCWVVNPTAIHTAATLELRTAAAGGGTAVITAVALASLTATTKFQQLTFAAFTDVWTYSELYPRLTVVSANVGTADLMLEYMQV